MTIPAYDVGDKLRLGNHLGDNADDTAREAFTDITGSPTDPTTVSLELRKPDGTDLVYNWPTLSGGDGLMTQEGIGRFFVDVTLDQRGLWWWIYSGTGTVVTAEQGAFYCRRSMIA